MGTLIQQNKDFSWLGPIKFCGLVFISFLSILIYGGQSCFFKLFLTIILGGQKAVKPILTGMITPKPLPATSPAKKTSPLPGIYTKFDVLMFEH